MGRESAPVTVEKSVNGIYKALTENMETGNFWNVQEGGLQDY